MRTKLGFVGILAAVLAVAVGVTVRMMTPAPRLQSENFDHIEIGMTQGEVEILLGGPPGDYGPPHFFGVTTRNSFEMVLFPAAVRHEVWQDDDNYFEIYFDAADRVCGRHKKISYQRTGGLRL